MKLFNPFRRKAKAPVFIISDEGRITLVLNGTQHLIGDDHPNYTSIINAMGAQDFDVLPGLVDIPKAMNAYCGGDVVINEYGEVIYNGEILHNSITRRITDFFQRQEDFKPLVKFLENIMANPSFNSREQLYTFLENEGMPITDDGCFVGYKGVNNDLKDMHTNSFDNSVGQVHEMDRALVDDNPNNHCSSGFHVGSQKYASGFGHRMLLVKVNPRDAVSVPSDHNSQKLRCCKYEVMEEVEMTKVLVAPLYAPSPLCDEDDDEEDACGYCGETYCEGECEECEECGYNYDSCDC